MSANWETSIALFLKLYPPIIASKIRIIPYSMQTRTTCLRLEIYGCKYKGLKLLIKLYYFK